MLLGGIIDGEERLDAISSRSPRLTIAGYVDERIRSPYVSPKVGGRFPVQVSKLNSEVPNNLYLVVGDEELEVQASRVSNATNPGPIDAWRLVHGWVSDLIADIRVSWDIKDFDGLYRLQSKFFKLYGAGNVGIGSVDYPVFGRWFF